jgi:hypothetical protein
VTCLGVPRLAHLVQHILDPLDFVFEVLVHMLLERCVAASSDQCQPPRCGFVASFDHVHRSFRLFPDCLNSLILPLIAFLLARHGLPDDFFGNVDDTPYLNERGRSRREKQVLREQPRQRQERRNVFRYLRRRRKIWKMSFPPGGISCITRRDVPLRQQGDPQTA